MAHLESTTVYGTLQANSDVLFQQGLTVNGYVGIGKTATTELDVDGTVTATSFVGALTGNASTADAWSTGRTIQLTGDVTGTSAAWTGSGNISFATTVVSFSGNAATATALETARTINGVSFNGTANITVEPYISSDDTGDTNCPIVFTANSTAGYKRLYEDSLIYIDNTNNNIHSTGFTGALTGNASTADAWSTGRTISLTGDVTGTSAAWTGSGNISITTSSAVGAVAPPVGSIIGIHPSTNTTKDISATYWLPCDSTGDSIDLTYADETTTSITRPNLSDSRFLLGGSGATVATGGSNTVLDHIHAATNTTASHSHAVSTVAHKHYIAYDNTVGSASDITSSNYMIQQNPTSGGDTYNYDLRGAANVSNVGLTSGTAPSGTAASNGASHTHTIGTGSVPSSTSSLPQYFKVLYYIRIK